MESVVLIVDLEGSLAELLVVMRVELLENNFDDVLVGDEVFLRLRRPNIARALVVRYLFDIYDGDVAVFLSVSDF